MDALLPRVSRQLKCLTALVTFPIASAWRPRQVSGELNYTSGLQDADQPLRRRDEIEPFAVPALVLPSGAEFWAERFA